MPDHDIDRRLKHSPSLPMKKSSLLGLESQLEGRFQVYHTSRAMKLFSREHRLGVLLYSQSCFSSNYSLRRRLHIHLESDHLQMSPRDTPKLLGLESSRVYDYTPKELNIFTYPKNCCLRDMASSEPVTRS